MRKRIGADRALAEALVEDHALALVGRQVVEAQRQIAWFALRDGHQVRCDRARDDALAEAEADVDHDFERARLRRVHRLHHARHPRLDHPLDDDAAVRQEHAARVARAGQRAFGPEAAPCQLQVIDDRRLAAHEQERVELARPRCAFGVFIAGRRPHRQVAFRAERAAGRRHRLRHRLGQRQALERSSDGGRARGIRGGGLPEDGLDGGAQRRGAVGGGRRRVEDVLERAVGDGEPRRHGPLAQHARHLGQVRRLRARGRLELDAAIRGRHDVGRAGLQARGERREARGRARRDYPEHLLDPAQLHHPRLAPSPGRLAAHAAREFHPEFQQPLARHGVEVLLSARRDDAGVEPALLQRRGDALQRVVQAQHREPQREHVVRRRGCRDVQGGLRSRLPHPPRQPRRHVPHGRARGVGGHLARGQLAQERHAVAQRAVRGGPCRREEDLFHRESDHRGLRHARGRFLHLVPRPEVMPPGHQRLILAGALEAFTRRRVLPQRLVQRQRGGIAAEERERALAGVHDDEVAVVDLVTDFPLPVPLDEPVRPDVAFPAVVFLGGERQHGLAAGRRLPSAVDDDGGLARLDGEQAEVAENAAAGRHHRRDAHQAGRVLWIEAGRDQHGAQQVARIPSFRAETGDARCPPWRGADAFGDPLPVEMRERRSGPGRAEEAAQLPGQRRRVRGQRLRRGSEHVVPPEQRHHRFRVQAGVLLPLVLVALPPSPPEGILGGAGEPRHPHRVAQGVERDHRLAQRHAGVLDGEAVDAAARAEAHVPFDEGHDLRQASRGGHRVRVGFEQRREPLDLVHAREAGRRAPLQPRRRTRDLAAGDGRAHRRQHLRVEGELALEVVAFDGRGRFDAQRHDPRLQRGGRLRRRIGREAVAVGPMRRPPHLADAFGPHLESRENACAVARHELPVGQHAPAPEERRPRLRHPVARLVAHLQRADRPIHVHQVRHQVEQQLRAAVQLVQRDRPLLVVAGVDARGVDRDDEIEVAEEAADGVE